MVALDFSLKENVLSIATLNSISNSGFHIDLLKKPNMT